MENTIAVAAIKEEIELEENPIGVEEDEKDEEEEGGTENSETDDDDGDPEEAASRTKERFPCGQCDKSYSTVWKRNHHVKHWHGDKEKRHKCMFCPFGTRRSDSLDCHVRTVHLKLRTVSQGAKAFFCEQCDKKFLSASHLKDHVRVHDGEKPFKCRKCVFETGWKANLVQHERAAHQKLRPFACDACDYRATTKFVLARHVRTVHEKAKPFACDRCEYRCARRSCLERHAKTKH